jgi:hypothetical protein
VNRVVALVDRRAPAPEAAEWERAAPVARAQAAPAVWAARAEEPVAQAVDLVRRAPRAISRRRTSVTRTLARHAERWERRIAAARAVVAVAVDNAAVVARLAVAAAVRVVSVAAVAAEWAAAVAVEVSVPAKVAAVAAEVVDSAHQDRAVEADRAAAVAAASVGVVAVAWAAAAEDRAAAIAKLRIHTKERRPARGAVLFILAHEDVRR